ncbi:MAG TPA: hypothetical protein DCY07_05915, partial [Rhodospirillaceae bacterium]|nr:hypothetical protein [Rhodospirillaceae bacterium]
MTVGDKTYAYFNLKTAETTLGDLAHLPTALRLLLENMLRHEDGVRITAEDIRTLTSFHALQKKAPQIVFTPTHLVIGDEAGVSALSDIAALVTTIEPYLDAPSSVASNNPLDIIVAQ